MILPACWLITVKNRKITGYAIMTTDDRYTDHEVRIRLLENICERMDFRFDMLEQKIDLKFRQIIFTIIVQITGTVILFGGIVPYIAKLI